MLDLDLPSHAIEEWTPVDSLVWLKAFAWDLKADYADELTRARLPARMASAASCTSSGSSPCRV